jgi:queuine tRNA-ribosyltransferase
MDFPGYAIGGVSVGEPKHLAHQAIEYAEPHLPTDKIRYLMGVGAPEDLVNGIARGIDLFDCALPTRVARNGGLFTAEGRVNIRGARFEKLDRPVDEGCDCSTCGRFSAAYLRHLLRANELLYFRLASTHNLRFIWRLVEQVRQAIAEGRFATFSAEFLARYRPTDEEVRLAQKAKWLAARTG